MPPVDIGSLIRYTVFMIGPLWLAYMADLPTWIILLCGSLAVLTLGSFILFALKAWEQIRPSQAEIREREMRRTLKVKGSLVKNPPHRPVVPNSVAPAFRQAGLGPYMPLVETHPFIYPSGEESEKIDLTKFIMHLLHDNRLGIHETHDGKLIISQRDLSNMPFGVVLEQEPGSEGAWRAHVEQFGPGSLDEHAELSVVGDKYANEWVFSFAPMVALIAAAGHQGPSWIGTVPWVTIALALGAVGWSWALISVLAHLAVRDRRHDSVM